MKKTIKLTTTILLLCSLIITTSIVALAASESTLSISNYNTPSDLVEGNIFSIKGTIKSNYKITSVTVGVYNSEGKAETSKTVSPNATSYDISKVDNYILFNKLTTGTKTYKVTATDEKGTKTLVSKSFKVTAVTSTLSISNYNTPSDMVQGNVFSIKGTIMSNYKITSVTVGVYNSDGKAETSKTVSPNSTSYDISKVDNYILFNKLTTGTKTYKVTATDEKGSKTLVSKSFNVTSSAASTLSISNYNTPSDMVQGNVFSIKGTIKSNYKISSVTVGVYNSDGKAETSKTVTPNSTSYDVSNVDSYILFNKLTTGTKTYKVTATDEKGMKTLVNNSFKVISSSSSSSSSSSMVHPVQGTSVVTQEYKKGSHSGIDFSYNGVSSSDISANSTRSIVAVQDGTVVKVLNNCSHTNNSSCTCNSGTGFGGYGNCVLIKHTDGTFSFYAHLMKASITVSANDQVKQGTIIAKMGNSGSVSGKTGIHLHFEIRKGNWPSVAYSNLTTYNPADYIPLFSTSISVAGTGTASLGVGISEESLSDYESSEDTPSDESEYYEEYYEEDYSDYESSDNTSSDDVDYYPETEYSDNTSDELGLDNTITLEIGEEYLLTAYINSTRIDWDDIESTSCLWSSSDDSIVGLGSVSAAEVTGRFSLEASSLTIGSSSVLLVGVDPGLATITVTLNDGSSLSREVIVNGFYSSDEDDTETSIDYDASSTKIYFTDVNEADWYYESVSFVVEKGLFDGMGDGSFSSKKTMTREMFVTVLGRMAEAIGVSTGGYDNTFTDVQDGIWYTNYIAWGAANGLVEGYDSNTFGLGRSITREQMAVLFVRFAEYVNVTLDSSSSVQFTDSDSIRSYARDAVDTCSNSGLINGYEDGTFRPNGNATRAEVATTFMRFMKQYVVVY